jgi:hypothetical protein
MNRDFWAFYLGYYFVKLFKLVIVLIIIFFIAKLFFGCNSIEPDHKLLYEKKLVENSQLLYQVDSIAVIVIYLNNIIRNQNRIINQISKACKNQIDSLNNWIAFKDSHLVIMCENIEYAIEHISDEGLNNLIEIRNK